MLWIKKIKEHKSIKDKTVNLLSMTAGRNHGNLISDWYLPKNTPRPYWPFVHSIFLKYLKLFVKEYYKQHSNNIEIIIDNYWYQNYLKKSNTNGTLIVVQIFLLFITYTYLILKNKVLKFLTKKQ